MSQLVAGVFATVVTIPIIGLFLVYFILCKITRRKRNSMLMAIDISTALFILSVYYLTEVIWGQSMFWLILLVIVLIAMVVVILQWKIKQDIDIRKVLKGSWRFSFLFFFSAYIILFVYGLIDRVLAFVNT
ncbi:DUF3397 domain-containing protein [Cytobacillus sp. IB215665]|uniref:DUF3397 domain-containing protein n=1 Tax=Cytobacillus sp. IB215665 TaxID=3097357 RepID=UPI002A0CCEF2|nr:DUF3397 domain-containing protein [Cytobacillus sp. IB215665]MDX8364961.1 DUF3397 domain-containing protein [Cytobacillus sp. IB215665]